MKNEQQCREAFEAWYISRGGSEESLERKYAEYISLYSEDAYHQFKAGYNAKAQERPLTPPKGEKMPQDIEHFQACWERDQELMFEQKEEISKLKEKVNKLQQSKAQESQWVSVDDRLPEDESYVDVFSKSDGRIVDVLFNGGIFSHEVEVVLNYANSWTEDTLINDVTHWMPRPSPPKEQKEK